MPKLTTTSNRRVRSLQSLIAPATLLQELPLDEKGSDFVTESRNAIARVLHGQDSRIVAVVGPCSIHDPAAALEYASKLKAAAARLADDLLIVMRVYFEKPRTTVGWKGLINDPRLDGSFAINDGLRAARKLLREIVALGIPTGCEFLDPISPQFTSDLVAWGAIGARTTESQVHRELASGLSMPVGFKNGTDGNIRIAVEGVLSAQHPHHFLGVNEGGEAAIVSTSGNPDCHVILRGKSSGPNYDAASVAEAASALAKEKLPARLMIDLSHGNSSKDFRRQPEVARDICAQLESGGQSIMGVMMESFLVEGRQDLKDPAKLVYGQSVTDGCMDWTLTERTLEALATAAAKRRR